MGAWSGGSVDVVERAHGVAPCRFTVDLESSVCAFSICASPKTSLGIVVKTLGRGMAIMESDASGRIPQFPIDENVIADLSADNMGGHSKTTPEFPRE